jgi:UDP-N-acetylmuramate--alanine ligase
VLERAGLDPTAVIGGRLNAFGSSARLGHGDWMVAEADESDRSFLKLSPTIAVLTNIDDEHLENYKDLDDLERAFVDFANKVPPHGMVVACADDRGLAAIRQRLTATVMTYGLDALGCDVTAFDAVLEPLGSRAIVERRIPAKGGGAADVVTLGSLRLGVPGRHNLQNALAAVAVGLHLGLPFEQIAAALEEFRGAERRFEIRGETGGILVVDDYGHHPTEIAAALSAAREFERPIIAVFQPHRFTRTARLMGRFGPAFEAASVVVLTDIYPAGEDPIDGITVDALAAAVRQTFHRKVLVVPTLEDVAGVVADVAQRGDLVITLGAGSIGSLADRIVAALGARS